MTAMTSTDASPPAEAVGPLMRGIAVLREISDAGGRTSLSDLVRTTGLARSTVDRIAATFARMGYLRLDSHSAALTPRLMELGNAYLASLQLPRLLGPLAEQLAEELDESVSLAVPDGDGIRFVHQTTRRRAMSLTFRIGDLLPAERTAPGPLFAAGWSEQEWARWRERRAADPEDRGFPAVPPRTATDGGPGLEERAARAGKQGWALDDQLIEPGLIALAVPVHSPDGQVVCAVSAVSHTSRHSVGSLRQSLLPRVRKAVAAMERELRQARPAPSAPPAGLASWTTASKQELGAEFVESLARGLTVLTAFGEGRPELSLTAVAEATGLARATARRALITLEHLGYVASWDRTFRLTPQVLALGCPPLSRTTLPAIATPHLAALVQSVHDSASLARTELRALTPHTVTAPAELATLLDRVGQEGYALVDEELEEGLCSLAVPVRDRAGRAVAAVNVAMHSSRRTAAQCLTEVLPELRATAARIEADLHVAGRFTHIPSA
jgi:IclR family pca regulon transcriptional regulator